MDVRRANDVGCARPQRHEPSQMERSVLVILSLCIVEFPPRTVKCESISISTVCRVSRDDIAPRVQVEQVPALDCSRPVFRVVHQPASIGQPACVFDVGVRCSLRAHPEMSQHATASTVRRVFSRMRAISRQQLHDTTKTGTRWLRAICT